MVEIVQLSPAALQALADGDLTAADRHSPVPLSEHLAGPDHQGLWRRRGRQVTADPAAAAWVTGVVWDGSRAVGRAGFHGPPDERGMVEVGYSIDPAYRRQGYARAALEVLLDRAAREPAVLTVRASIRPDNLASRALVAGYGFVEVGEQLDDEDGPETVFEVPAIHRWRTTARVALLHPSSALVLDTEPAVELRGRVELPEFLAAFRARGLEPAVLATVSDRYDQAAFHRQVRLLATPRGPVDGQWVEPGPELAGPVRAATGPGERPRQPWLRRDWLPAAEAWLRGVTEPTGPVRQHRVWDLSTVLSVPTATGPVWLKATVDAPLFAPEAAVTVALDRLFPGRVPRPVAAELDRGWLALADFGPELGWRAPMPDRAAALRDWARLQRESVPHLAELRAAGCRDRSLDWLAGAVGEWFRAGPLSRIAPAATATALAAAVPALVGLCGRLAAYGVPDTLQHGDLHLANVARGTDGYLFFDWTDAAIGHPFVDVIAAGQDDDPTVRARLREAYLAEWPGEYAAAWPLAEALAAANQAVSYLAIGRYLGNDRPDALFTSYTVQWLDTVLRRLAAVGPSAP